LGGVNMKTIKKVVCRVEEHERRPGVWSLFEIEILGSDGKVQDRLPISLDFPVGDEPKKNVKPWMEHAELRNEIKRFALEEVQKKYPQIKDIKKFVVKYMSTPDDMDN
ncbi:MAG: hypothetical protein NT157_04560, partial [Candidatus Micrarchaeota archaeon]|nr:hypothetical protein [Candidatus Micrarchaeota archaeon]